MIIKYNQAKAVKTFNGYIVEIPTNSGANTVYVKSYYKHGYTFTLDYSHARRYTKATANKHAKKLNTPCI